VRDEQRRAALQHLAEVREDLRLGARVDRGEAVVEEEDRRIDRERPGDRRALPLSAREIDAALAEQRVEAGGERADLGEEARIVRGLREPGFVGGLETEADVLADRVAEQERVLRHVAARASELRERQTLDGNSVHENGAGRRVDEARHEREQRALARAGRADDRDRPPGGDAEGDAGESGRRGARVRERQVAELDVAADGIELRRVRQVGDVRRGLEHLGEAPHRHAPALPERHHPAQRDHGPHQHQPVLVERDEPAQRQLAARHHPEADEDRQHEAETAHQPDDRIEERLAVDGREVRRARALRLRAERRDLVLLARERLDDAHAREALLGPRGHGRLRFLHLRLRRVQARRDPQRGERDADERREVQDGQRGAHGPHLPDRDRREDDRVDDVHEPRADAHPHGLDVGGEAREDVAGVVARHPRGAPPEQPFVETVAQAALHLARDAHDVPPHQVLEDAADRRDEDEDDRPPGGEADVGRRSRERVDRALHVLGGEALRDLSEGDRREADRERGAPRPEEGQEQREAAHAGTSTNGSGARLIPSAASVSARALSHEPRLRPSLNARVRPCRGLARRGGTPVTGRGPGVASRPPDVTRVVLVRLQ
jgi:hypothetical protein